MEPLRAPGKLDRQALEGLDVAAHRLRQAHQDVKTPVALERAGLTPADGRGCRLLHLGHAEAQPCQRPGRSAPSACGQAGRLFHLHIGGSGTPCRTFEICSAVDSMTAMSSPNTFTATSLRTPEISSLKRIWIGCVNS